jgi:hypothetical protein
VLVALVPNQQAMLDEALYGEISRYGGRHNRRVYRGQRSGAYVGDQVLHIRSLDGSDTVDTIAAGTGAGEQL